MTGQTYTLHFAMADDKCSVSRLLREVSDRVEAGTYHGPILVNGHLLGHFEVGPAFGTLRS